jgi:hypothetical protein
LSTPAPDRSCSALLLTAAPAAGLRRKALAYQLHSETGAFSGGAKCFRGTMRLRNIVGHLPMHAARHPKQAPSSTVLKILGSQSISSGFRLLPSQIRARWPSPKDNPRHGYVCAAQAPGDMGKRKRAVRVANNSSTGSKMQGKIVRVCQRPRHCRPDERGIRAAGRPQPPCGHGGGRRGS